MNFSFGNRFIDLLIIYSTFIASKSGGMHRSSSRSSGWGGSTRRGHSSNQDSEDIDPNNPNAGMPRLSVCADSQKVDRAKLSQTEVFSSISYRIRHCLHFFVVVFNSNRWRYFQMQPKQFGSKG